MANYLILCVGQSKADIAEKWFSLADEKKSDLLKMDFSNEVGCYYFANQAKLDRDNGCGVFKGYAIDHVHKKIVYSGGAGVPNVNRALPGCYIRLRKDAEDIVVSNDLFAHLPMLYFMADGVVAISDSVLVLTQLRRQFGLAVRANVDAALSRAWIHGMGSQLLGTSTLVDEISFCTPGTRIRIQSIDDKPRAQIERVLAPDLFLDHVNDYRETLLEGAQRIASVVATMPGVPDSHTSISVSGGVDSRVVLAAALIHPDVKAYSFMTGNTHPKDYAVAQQLAKNFGFVFGSEKRPKNAFQGQVPNWFLSCAGIYDPLQAPASAPLDIKFSMGGHGAEVYKGNYRWRPLSAMTPDKVGHVAVIQRQKEKLPSIFNNQVQVCIRKFRKAIGKPEPKVGIEVSEAAYREASKGLHAVGVCPESQWASEWHYLCFRNAIHAGRSTMRSLLNVSPILQRELVGLSYSAANPYPAPLDGSPSVVTDLLIALNPELAIMPFDDAKKNMSVEYVRERSKFLGQVNRAEPYSVIGDPKKVNSGTPAFFLRLASERGFEGNFSHESVKKLALEGFEAIPDNLRHVYEFPKIIMEQGLPPQITTSSWHCNAAGKLMAFLLMD